MLRPFYKVIVAGSRTATSEATYQLLTERLDNLLSQKKETHLIVIVSGTANGADKLGERYAGDRNCRVERFPADWDRHGKSAGYKRNVQMAENADALVALWDGKSRGTKHMLDIARERNIPSRTIYFETYGASK
jgi:hypothetical protein|tara:strand:+ start:2595 stop:2996 length:402 start_codon:yes stop_codon:yes gene_type:complete